MPEPPQLPSGQQPILLDQPREQKLLQEIEGLRKELDEEKKKREESKPKPLNRRKLWLFLIVGAILIVLAFLAGYIPHLRHEREVKREAAEKEKMLPVLTYIVAKRSPAMSELDLPGTMEAITEAPILARANGFLGKRYADIGDRVRQGQLLAEIDAPDLDQQVRQGQSQLLQLRAALRQAIANLDQGKANQGLAKVTAERYAGLLVRGAVSRQENDQQQSAFQASNANVGALQEAISSAEQNIGAGEANLERLRDLQGYEKVRAPFSGVITLRNVDTGALISTGNTLLYRIAETDRLRTFIYVPETNAPTVQTGQSATLYVMEYPGRRFEGVITRTANSMDPSTRTMLTEVQVANPNGVLLPGTYAQVTLNSMRENPPVMIPGDALLVHSDGTYVGVLEDEQAPQVAPGQNGHRPANQQQDGKQQADGKQQPDAKQQGNGKQQGGEKQGDAKQGQDGKQGKKKESAKQELSQEEEQQKELPTFTVHLVRVNIGRDYGNDIEIVSGLNGGENVISNPNDSVQNQTKVKGMLSNQPPGADSQASGQGNANVDTQKRAPQPGGEKSTKQPAKGRDNRGPGF
jgi:RND family efflux transporter MFP subunit